MTTRIGTAVPVRCVLGIVRVEGKQAVLSQSGAHWTIDAKGILIDRVAFLVVECQRHTTSRQEQKDLGALAYAIKDTGAD